MFCKIWITRKETSENKGENQQQTKTTYQVASGNEKPIKLLSALATNTPLFHTARVKVQTSTYTVRVINLTCHRSHLQKGITKDNSMYKDLNIGTSRPARPAIPAFYMMIMCAAKRDCLGYNIMANILT